MHLIWSKSLYLCEGVVESIQFIKLTWTLVKLLLSYGVGYIWIDLKLSVNKMKINKMKTGKEMALKKSIWLITVFMTWYQVIFYLYICIYFLLLSDVCFYFSIWPFIFGVFTVRSRISILQILWSIKWNSNDRLSNFKHS